MHLCTQNIKCVVQKYANWDTPLVFLIIVESQIIETHYSAFIRYFTYINVLVVRLCVET